MSLLPPFVDARAPVPPQLVVLALVAIAADVAIALGILDIATRA